MKIIEDLGSAIMGLFGGTSYSRKRRRVSRRRSVRLTKRERTLVNAIVRRTAPKGRARVRRRFRRSKRSIRYVQLSNPGTVRYLRPGQSYPSA